MGMERNRAFEDIYLLPDHHIQRLTAIIEHRTRTLEDVSTIINKTSREKNVRRFLLLIKKKCQGIGAIVQR